LNKAEDSAHKALALNDRVAAAHTSLAIINWWKDRKFEQAEAEFRRALELDPNDPRAHSYFGSFLITIGRTEEGVQQAKWATELDPLSVEMSGLLGQSYYFARNYNQAITQLKQTIDSDPNFWRGHSFLGRTYLRKDQFSPAIDELKKAVELEPNVAENKAVLAFAYARAGKKDDAAHTFDALKKDADIYLPKYDEAKYYIGIGDKDHAFELLDQALAADSFHMTWLKVDPELDLLRDDPRFAQLVAKVGLPN
jgi:Tfp pilus assembly protein PilF